MKISNLICWLALSVVPVSYGFAADDPKSCGFMENDSSYQDRMKDLRESLKTFLPSDSEIKNMEAKKQACFEKLKRMNVLLLELKTAEDKLNDKPNDPALLAAVAKIQGDSTNASIDFYASTCEKEINNSRVTETVALTSMDIARKNATYQKTNYFFASNIVVATLSDILFNQIQKLFTKRNRNPYALLDQQSRLFALRQLLCAFYEYVAKVDQVSDNALTENKEGKKAAAQVEIERLSREVKALQDQSVPCTTGAGQDFPVDSELIKKLDASLGEDKKTENQDEAIRCLRLLKSLDSREFREQITPAVTRVAENPAAKDSKMAARLVSAMSFLDSKWKDTGPDHCGKNLSESVQNRDFIYNFFARGFYADFLKPAQTTDPSKETAASELLRKQTELKAAQTTLEFAEKEEFGQMDLQVRNNIRNILNMRSFELLSKSTGQPGVLREYITTTKSTVIEMENRYHFPDLQKQLASALKEKRSKVSCDNLRSLPGRLSEVEANLSTTRIMCERFTSGAGSYQFRDKDFSFVKLDGGLSKMCSDHFDYVKNKTADFSRMREQAKQVQELGLCSGPGGNTKTP